MSREFTSVLASDMRAFIEFKHAAGVAFVGGQYLLGRLDAYLTATGAQGLTKDAVEGFIADYDGDRVGADRSYFSYLRGFAKFMRIRGLEAYELDPVFNRSKPRPPTYLLSSAQINRFFAIAASNVPYPGPWRWQATAFFGLMYACGLRTGEARNLTRRAVNLGKGYLDILDSKGPRSRRLPLTDEVVTLLHECDLRTSRFAPDRTTFFVSGRGNPVTNNTPVVVFKRIWAAADLPVPIVNPKPIPYAFRHHFAYANIERWAAGGIDPLTMLPYLARYMGHADISSTYYYLGLSPDYAATYAATANTSQALIPEVSDD